MSYVGDQAQQGYYPDPHSPSTSTTHLLNPNGPLSPLPSPSSASFAAIQSRPGGNIPSAPPSPVHAAFRGPPSKRSSVAGSSIFNGPPPVNPYEAHGRSSSIASKFSLAADPAAWAADFRGNNQPEPDDELHNPDPRRDRKYDAGGTIFTLRGIANLGCLAILCFGIMALFAGYPITSWALKKFASHPINVVTMTNSTGQVPSIGNFGLIDDDTPDWARTRLSFTDGTTEYTLVFSDEFNTDGRTFYPGDDPYWEAVDLHYWQTNNMEWYDPAAITTADGALQISLTQKETHGLDYQGGMIQTWNKFCFTGGLLETSVVLPGVNNVVGLWPAVWTMGNLGRAGYGASLEGMWPYTYDSCDVGTVANQTLKGLPVAATENGDPSYNGVLSYLPGQRLSRCTCPGESHPGPMHDDGTYVGRSAPEIDMFEAQVSNGVGYVSQSGQFGPFNYEYIWDNTTDNYNIPNKTATSLNAYMGGVYQQAVSGISLTEQDCYQLGTACFSVYGIEYKPGFDDSYISWIAANETAWTLKGAGMGADTATEIGARPIPQEPMYILINLGISTAFGSVDVEHLTFPAIMTVDYIRVYQESDSINIGCDPDEFPTKDYINTYIEAYSNPNLTTWKDDYGEPFPSNSFLGQC
ncbi:beta-glucan synthesis-associated [Stereum hirsutum FP-91666 SS1]|uniref:beta-glucan synthesis-associated n=1 Tax=Stereum hirsutum (strain FP-91666) TaxID=721885 RepID=UPI000440DD6A|nr:beta-glucan synthesis-associated [Stereum hirsutum FP-91666 SS1]EIM92126.1 beta-glucan synthesis-associated [Stereum hirsutum FP-91666 SS1]